MSLSPVDRFFHEVIPSHDTGALEKLLHPSFHSHHFPMPPGSDKKEFIQGMKTFFEAFPDISLTVREQLEKGDRVFSYGSWTATHKGAFMGVAPTNKKVTVEFMDIWRVEGERLRENWVVMDIMGLMVQLEAVPALAHR